MAFNHATMDIEIRWKDGMFYPSGSKELDEKLVDEAFGWLREVPNEREDFRKAVLAYTAKRYSDVGEPCYRVIEGLARAMLGNGKTLDNNRDALLSRVGLSAPWATILSKFIEYAHDFRHASDNRHAPNPIEVEGFLYMTGLLVRMIVEAEK